MRRGLAVAIAAVLAATGLWYWQSGHARGVEFLTTEPLLEEGAGLGFGGLSAIDFGGNGQGYLLSDRGTLFEVGYDKLGALEVGQGVDLRDENGDLLPRPKSDSEGLAVLPDGRLAISFEWWHRVDVFETDGRLSEALRTPEKFADFQSNSGLEALAVDHEGRLIAIPERSGGSAVPFPVFIYDGAWREGVIPRRGAFLPVGADFGPRGRFYLLERDYLLGGFRSRIRRFDWDGERLTGEKELLKTRFWRHGNLEGIALRRAGGDTLIEMVSDNNFLPVQRSELVRYRLKTP